MSDIEQIRKLVNYNFGGKTGKRKIPDNIATIIDALVEQFNNLSFTPLMKLMIYEQLIDVPTKDLHKVVKQLAAEYTKQTQASTEVRDEEVDLEAALLMLKFGLKTKKKVLDYVEEQWTRVSAAGFLSGVNV